MKEYAVPGWLRIDSSIEMDKCRYNGQPDPIGASLAARICLFIQEQIQIRNPGGHIGKKSYQFIMHA